MKILKKYHNIFLTLALIFIFNVGYAHTNGSEKPNNQEQEQDGRRKADQSMVRPDGDVASHQTGEVKEEPKSEPQVREVSYTPEDKPDSVEDDSVSKYNFIFYFLYKFKYEEEAP